MNTHQSTATDDNDQHFLNTYKILNLENLKWDVTIYKCESINSQEQGHEDRSKIKNIMWELRSQFKDRCRGYGFVIDIDPKTIAVPQKWDILQQTNYNGYRIVPQKSQTTKAIDPNHCFIVAAILREGIKYNFKSSQMNWDFCGKTTMISAKCQFFQMWIKGLFTVRNLL